MRAHEQTGSYPLQRHCRLTSQPQRNSDLLRGALSAPLQVLCRPSQRRQFRFSSPLGLGQGRLPDFLARVSGTGQFAHLGQQLVPKLSTAQGPSKCHPHYLQRLTKGLVAIQPRINRETCVGIGAMVCPCARALSTCRPRRLRNSPL